MINKVSIENFRSLKKVEIDLILLHAIVGENGTGKTSILEAINYVTSREYASRKIDEQDFHSDEPIQIKVYFDKYFSLQTKDGYATKNILCNGVFLRVKRREKASPGRALSDGVTIEHLVIPVTYSNQSEIKEELLPEGVTRDSLPTKLERTEQGFEAPRASSSNPWQISAQTLSFNGGDLVGFPSIFYFDRYRESEAKMGYNSLFQKISKELDWRYLKSVNSTQTSTDWETYYNPVVESVKSEKRSNILDPIRNDAQRILGKDFSNFEIGLHHLKQPFKQSFFSLRNPGEITQIEFSKMGSGVCTLIAYLLLKTISNLSKQEVVFLIDEPEMHLHSQARTALFEEFLNSSNQIVYTTHSEFFVDLTNWKGVLRIDEKNNTFPLPETLEETINGQTMQDHLDEIKTWHQDKTIYNKENNEIFFARKVILTEGPIDKFGIRRFEGLMGIRITDSTIISCNGKSKIPYYQLLCKAFGIPYFTLIDLDTKAETDTENKSLIDWVENDASAKFENSFENSLGINPDTHKGSEVLKHIESITSKETIPQDIREAIEKIQSWSTSD